jgi:hypothetical protein
MKTSARFALPPTLLIAGVAALSLTVAVARPPLAFADRGDDTAVPTVPPNLQVPPVNGGPELGRGPYDRHQAVSADALRGLRSD